VFRKRVNAFENIRQLVVHFAKNSIRRIFESILGIFNGNHDNDDNNNTMEGERVNAVEVDMCLSRRCSPLHRIDRFPGLCVHIRDTVHKHLPECVEKAIASLDKHLEVEMTTLAMDTNGHTVPFLSTLLDKWAHMVTVAVHLEVQRVLKTLYYTVIPAQQAAICYPSEQPQQLQVPNISILWVEHADFSREREKLEAKLHRLQVQLERLEKCVLTADRSNHNTELRLAVDQAASESAGFCSSSSNAVDNASLWVSFWKEAVSAKVKKSYVEEMTDAAIEAARAAAQLNEDDNIAAYGGYSPVDDRMYDNDDHSANHLKNADYRDDNDNQDTLFGTEEEKGGDSSAFRNDEEDAVNEEVESEDGNSHHTNHNKKQSSQNSTDTSPRTGYVFSDFIRSSFGTQPASTKAAVKVEQSYSFSQPQRDIIPNFHPSKPSAKGSFNAIDSSWSPKKRSLLAENAPQIDPQQKNQAWNRFKSSDLLASNAVVGGHRSVKPVVTAAVDVDLTKSEEESYSIRHHLPMKSTTVSNSQRSSNISSSFVAKKTKLPMGH